MLCHLLRYRLGWAMEEGFELFFDSHRALDDYCCKRFKKLVGKSA